MLTDIDIAQRAKMLPIGEIAARLGIPDDALEPYGRTKAKISLDCLDEPRRSGRTASSSSSRRSARRRPARARRRRRSAWATR